jgi:hypothetical protein
MRYLIISKITLLSIVYNLLPDKLLNLLTQIIQYCHGIQSILQSLAATYGCKGKSKIYRALPQCTSILFIVEV